jgi:hypothetical protein
MQFYRESQAMTQWDWIRASVALAVLTVVGGVGNAAAEDARRPLKVYILAGQSNMEGQAKVETFDYIGDDRKTAPMLKDMRGPDGKPHVCERVWISYLTGSADKDTPGAGGLKAMRLGGRDARRPVASVHACGRSTSGKAASASSAGSRTAGGTWPGRW